ncbi:hypothetical protein LJB63_26655, partial [[Eubacterium] rectale]|nr:hypothetical protein [Agathobacter rectalis]
MVQLEQEPGIQTMCLSIIPWLQKRCFPDQFRYGGVNVHRVVLYRDGFRFLFIPIGIIGIIYSYPSEVSM